MLGAVDKSSDVTQYNQLTLRFSPTMQSFRMRRVATAFAGANETTPPLCNVMMKRCLILYIFCSITKPCNLDHKIWENHVNEKHT